MDTAERNQLYYDHITQVWLAPDPDSNDIDCLLRGENKTNLRLLSRGMYIAILFSCII